MNITAEPATLPESAPPQRFTIPDLWTRARSFIASMFDQHGDARALVLRNPLSARERNAVLDWLIPAERLVRQLLLVGAITHLLMTPEGRRIRARARPITPPAPPPPPPLPFGTTRMLTIPLGATIARHYRHRPTRTPRPPVDPLDPDTWRTPFRILRWDTAHAPSGPPPRRVAQPSAPPAPNLAIARRIEALRRTLAHTRARLLHTARYLARLPRGILGLPAPNLYRRNKPMPVLRDERFAVFAFADSAVECFDSS